MNTPIFEGCATALVTPFTKDGERIDFAAWERLINRQIESGITNFVVLGTTGENPTIEWDEETAIIQSARDVIGKRGKMIVGTGSNCTKHAVKASEKAMNLGADAVLAVTPYYNKPSQQGLENYYTEIAKEAPTIMYNVPGRTGVNLLPETAARLAQNPGIVGFKEANPSQMAETAHALDDLPWYSGDDLSNFTAYTLGAKGAISVTANLLPEQQQCLYRFVKAGLVDQRARELHQSLLPVNKALFCETNPIPVKAALADLGLCEPTTRPPLTPMQPENFKHLKKAITTFFKER